MKIMLKVLLSCAMAVPMSAAAQAGGCEGKQQSIEREIAYARTHHGARRVHGLEMALAGLKANCTDTSLRNARQRKVAEAQRDLAEREQALQDAKTEGRSPGKIADRQRKVDEAHADLERAQIEARS